MSADDFNRDVQAFKERLRTMIARAELSEGVRIDEPLLRHETGVTVRAARQALSELAREGLIVRKPHVGTFVSGRLPGAAFAVLPKLRSVGILSSRSQSFFATSTFGYTIMRGVEASLHAPMHISFFVHAETRPMSLDDLPLTETDTIKRSCQGLLAIEANHASRLNEIAGNGVAVVAIDFNAPGAAFDAVEVDHFSAGYQTTRHLIALGHRRIAFIGEAAMPESTDPTWQSRLSGYIRAMLEAGLEVSQETILGMGRSDRRIPALLPPFHQRCQPTAYVLCSGSLAPIASRTLSELGLNVPADISFAAADSSLLDLNAVPLSQARVDYELLGRSAIRLLASRLACKAMPPLHVTQPVGFVPGATSRAR